MDSLFRNYQNPMQMNPNPAMQPQRLPTPIPPNMQNQNQRRFDQPQDNQQYTQYQVSQPPARQPPTPSMVPLGSGAPPPLGQYPPPVQPMAQQQFMHPMQKENEDLKAMLENMNKQNNQLLLQQNEIQAQLDNYRRTQPQSVERSGQYEVSAMVDGLEKKCMMLMNELDRVNKVLETRNRDFIQLENELLSRQPDNDRDMINYRRASQEREHQMIFEIETLRQKLADFDKTHTKNSIVAEISQKLQIITMEMEKQNSILGMKIEENNELRQVLLQYQNDSQTNYAQPQVQQEMTRMKTLLEMKSAELDQAKDKATQAGELQQKVIMVTLELERLNETLRVRTEEHEKCKIKLKSYEDNQMQVFSLQNAVESQSIQLKQKLQQIANFSDEINRISNQLKSKSDQYNTLELEIEKLQARFEEKNSECDELRKQISKLRIQISETRLYAEGSQALQNEYDRQQQILKNKENEIVHYKQELHKYNLKTQEMQSQIAQLVELIKNLEQYKRKSEEYDSYRQSMGEKTNALEAFQNENASYQIKIKELEASVQALELERRRLSDVVRVKSEDYEALKTQFQQLTLQHGRLSEQLIIIQELHLEIDQWKQRCARLESQVYDSQREAQAKARQHSAELEQYKTKFSRSQQDLQNETLSEIQKLRIENGSLKQKNTILETQIQELQSGLQQQEIAFRRDLEFMLQKQQQEFGYKKSEEQNVISQLSVDLQEMSNQNEMLKKALAQIEEQNQYKRGREDSRSVQRIQDMEARIKEKDLALQDMMQNMQLMKQQMNQQQIQTQSQMPDMTEHYERVIAKLKDQLAQQGYKLNSLQQMLDNNQVQSQPQIQQQQGYARVADNYLTSNLRVTKIVEY